MAGTDEGQRSEMVASDNLLVIEAFLKEFGAGSLDAAFSMVTADAQWSIVQVVRGTTMTVPELRSRLVPMRSAMQDNRLELNIIDVVDGGDKLAIELESHAVTRLGPVYANRYCLVFQMKDGKIANVREYNDSLHVTQVLLPAVTHVMSQES